jgi:alkylation response protein AidB-like acyl-CoA dehydrogenase
MAQLGWLALPFDEALGGLGGGPLATALMMEQLGKGLVLEPYLPNLMLFGALLQSSATQREAWVPKLVDGSLQGALAWQERHGHHELADVQTTLRPEGDGFVLDGEKVLVFNGAAAGHLVVSARSAGASCQQPAEQQHRRQVGLEHQALAQLFHYHHDIHRAAAKTAMLLSEGNG